VLKKEKKEKEKEEEKEKKKKKRKRNKIFFCNKMSIINVCSNLKCHLIIPLVQYICVSYLFVSFFVLCSDFIYFG